MSLAEAIELFIGRTLHTKSGSRHTESAYRSDLKHFGRFLAGDRLRVGTVGRRDAERYLTPALKEFEEKVTTAEDRALAREKALFEQLCAAAAAHGPHAHERQRPGAHRGRRAAGQAGARAARRHARPPHGVGADARRDPDR